MKKGNLEMLFSMNRQRSIRTMILFAFLYLLFVSFELPFVFKNGFRSVSDENLFSNSYGFLSSNSKPFLLESEEKEAPTRPERKIKELIKNPLSSLNFTAGIVNSPLDSGIFKSAKDALELGQKHWRDLELIKKNGSGEGFIRHNTTKSVEKCPHSISIAGDEFSKNGKVVVLPCGLTLGSHITIVAKPRAAHAETNPKISLLKEGQYVMVSQFMMELQGLKIAQGEDPPRILHFNPRLKGDWIGKPVIEHNTCYRMQWGTSQRCEGWKSRADEETVDELVKCEKWIRDDDNGTEESKATWWLNRLIGRTKKVSINWPFPFVEEKLFVLTLNAGFEGYHINVDGRHVTSFPYHTGFTLEEATGLSLDGDIDVYSVFAASLPTSHPNYGPQRHLDMSEKWKAPLIKDGPFELFIGVLSAGNHFAERMAVRKSWMQHNLIKSSNVVARFFVALHARKDVNIEVKKEAGFFGDIVIVPYMDHYDLVVLKTVAICEYGIRTISANYVMKCDDDTFVRVDAILHEAKKVPEHRSLYIGNINYYHKPMRSGKWEVSYKEWPEEVYPPYANGPGYIISSDIANFIVSDFEENKLRLFKMEDVSMGMWVEKVNSSKPVEYVHSLKFCQFGCIEDYITSHYQSPRQMICLWKNLRELGKPVCCDIR